MFKRTDSMADAASKVWLRNAQLGGKDESPVIVALFGIVGVGLMYVFCVMMFCL